MNIGSILDGVKYGFRAAHTEEDWITPLQDAVQGVSFETAIWKPGKDVPSIWELVAHATPYIEALADDLSGRRAETAEDWPAAEDPSPNKWMNLQARLYKSVDDAQRAIEGLTEAEMLTVPAGRTKPIVVRIMDIAVHDAYHAGQIIKLQQAYASATDRVAAVQS